MKIHELQLENIASLRSKHTIDFDIIHRESGLFAITGKTGAGKSTILNAIGLALYGQNYKRGSSSNDFITLGENEGSISLLFSYQGKKYRSNWRLRLRKKNKELLKKPQLSRELLKEENNTTTALDYLPEEILELSFEEFCKTTILNQGQFSKFLASTFSERKSILEKFYEEDSLSLIGPYLKKVIKDLETKVDIKQSTITGITDSSSLEIKDEAPLKEEIKNINLAKDQLQEQLTNLKDLIQIIERQQVNDTRLINYQEEIKSITKVLNENKLNFDKLELDLKEATKEAKERTPILNECITRNTITKSLQDQIKTYTKNISDIQLRDKLIIGDIDKTNHQFNNNSLYIDKYSKLNSKYNIDLEIFSQAIQDYSDTNKKFNYTKDLLFEKEAILKKEYLQSVDLKEKFINITALLEKNLKIAPAHIESLMAQEQELVKLKELVQIELTRLKINLNELQNIELVSKTSSQKRKEISKKLVEQKEIIDSIQDSIKLHSLEQARKLCIDHSIELKACYLCGNENFNDSSPIKSTFNSDIIKKEKLAHKYQEEYEYLNNQSISLRTKIETNNEQKEKFELENKVIITTIKNLYPPKLMFLHDKKDLKDLIAPLDLKIANLRKQTQEMQVQENETKNLLINKDELQKRLNKNNSNTAEISLKINDLNTAKEDLVTKLDVFHHQFHVKDFKAPILPELKSIYDKLFKRQKLVDDNKHYSIQLKTYDELISKNAQQIFDIKKEIEKFREKINENDIFIKMSSPNKIPELNLEEIEQRVTQKNKIVKNSELEIKRSEIQYAEVKSKISNFQDQLKELSSMSTNITDSLSSFKIHKYIETHHPQIKKSLTSFNQITANTELKILTPLLAHTREQETLLKDLLDIAKSELAKTQALAKQKAENAKRIKSLSNEIHTLRADLEQYLELNELLGKDEFRNYVLAMIEKLIIKQTNHELQTLCQGRYSLIQDNKNGKMASEFKIIDYYHDAQARKVSTLSGGETFMVSLAMALALAELTRGKVEIDSLFIDEGFGTLDEDSIQEVLQLLQTIENQGKQIGIISHVSELTSKIPMNIHLEKNTRGES